MHKRFLRSSSRFFLVLSLTIVAILGFSKISTLVSSQPDIAAERSYIDGAENLEEIKEIQAVVTKESNSLPSILAFIALVTIPTAYLIFFIRKRKKDPNYFTANARRYSPKQEITFNNNTFDPEYNRSRM